MRGLNQNAIAAIKGLDVMAAIKTQEVFREDIEYIWGRVGNKTYLARQLGISDRRRLYEYKGGASPRDYAVRELIHQFAEQLRQLESQSPSQS